jgi:hypothetical protein
MWPRARRVFFVVVHYAALTAVAAIGLILLYRSTELEGSSRDRSFAYGAVLVLAAWTWTVVREKRHRWNDLVQFESAQQSMHLKVKALETTLAAVRSDVDSELAGQTFLEAMHRYDASCEEGWPPERRIQ